MEKNNGAVRILDVLDYRDVLEYQNITGYLSGELKGLPMYTVIDNGILKINAGIKRGQDERIVYDVTNSSPEFREMYGFAIKEMEVTQIIDDMSKKTTQAIPGQKIVTLMSLLGKYPSLPYEDKEVLGYDFVNVKDTEKGIKLDPVLTQRQRSGDTYLRLDTGTIPEGLLGTISSDLTELRQNENGLYDFIDSMEQQKHI